MNDGFSKYDHISLISIVSFLNNFKLWGDVGNHPTWFQKLQTPMAKAE